MEHCKQKIKQTTHRLKMLFAKQKIQALEVENNELNKGVQLLQGSIEMFQIQKEQNLQLMDELRLALQASVLERNQMREALEAIKDRTAFHTISPFKQINEVNEIAHKALGVRS